MAPEIQENNEKQLETIKNKGKWKKNEVANEKKMKLQMKKWSLMAKGDEQKWKNEDKMKKDNENDTENENENGNENENEKIVKK